MQAMNMNEMSQNMVSYEIPMDATTKVKVYVKNMTCNYRLTADDLQTVFSRYGKLANVAVGMNDASAATIDFVDYDDAVACVKSLNGKVLSGDKGTLVVTLEERQQDCYTQQSTPVLQPMQQMQRGQYAMPMQSAPSSYGGNLASPSLPYASNRMMGVPAMAGFPGAPNAMQYGGFNQDMNFNQGMPGSPGLDMMQHPSAADYAAAAAHAHARAFAAAQQSQHLQMQNIGHNDHADKAAERRRSKKSVSGDNSPSRVRKFTCRFDVGITNEKTFQVARRIIGSKGANMKKIFKETGAKLRLRGQGSGFLEGASQQESPEALHLCISAKKIDEYQNAVRKVEELLQGVYREYRGHCKQKDLPTPSLRVVCREHPLVTMHRNAMKAKEQNQDSVLETNNNNNSGSNSPVAGVQRESSNGSQGSQGLQSMIELAKKNGNDREVELLNELLKLRNSAPPSVASAEQDQALNETSSEPQTDSFN